MLCLLGYAALAMGAGTNDVSAWVEHWSAQGPRLGLPRGRRVAEVVRHEIDGGACILREARFEGGGFAVVAGSSSAGDVIAFSDRGELVESDDNPLWVLLKRHGAHLSAERARPLAMAAPTGVSDLRVAPLVESRWSQTSAAGQKCWNYYTPNGNPCGCVATAMSLVMRCHEWPESPVRIETNACVVTVGNTQTVSNLVMLGGPYEWAQMPHRPGDGGLTETNREALGRIVYDCGVAMHMGYSSVGSEALAEPIHLRFKDVFGYASAQSFFPDFGLSPSDSVLRNAVLASLDARCPVILGICKFVPDAPTWDELYQNGHCIVADGYGFLDGEPYVHLNFGWNDQEVAWYKLPDIGTDYGFNLIDSVVYNVFPREEGEILSGHIVDHGTNAVGVVVRAYRPDGTLQETATTDGNGVYSLIVPGSSAYSLRATLGDRTKELQTTAGHSASYVGFDWDTWFPEEGPEGLVCGNRWGLDIDFTEPDRDPRLFVSAESGSDESGTGAEDAPFATIDKALSLVVEGDTVFVGPGVYTGVVVAVSATVTIVSTDGPEATILDAALGSPCYFGQANPNSVLSGFTLQNGYCECGGGVLYGTVSNCVIRYCYAPYDPNMRGSGFGGGAYEATLYDTFLYGNEAEAYGGGAAACSLVRCTVYSNWAGGAGGGADADSVCMDSIVWGNGNFNGETDNWESYTSRGQTIRTVFDHSCTEPEAAGTGNLSADPMFVGEREADLRLRAASPCLGAASDGRNMGAYQGEGVAGARITVEVQGPGWVTPMSALLLPGETADFEATTGHPFVGYGTNGVVVADSVRVTLPCPEADLTLTARFATTNFCVDAANGDDANDGWSWQSAKKTIQAAADVLADGERIEVRPGVYDGFVSYSYDSEIVATDGPEATVLDARGQGRCFRDAGITTLRGFSLVNASASGYYGGGACGGQLVGCIVSNCTASAGGGAAWAVLENCVLVGNRSETQGGGAYDCAVDRCTVVGNRADAPRSGLSEFAGGGVDYFCDCTNSIVWGNVNAAGGTDNWEAYSVQTWQGMSVSVPHSMEHCCTEPWISIGSGNVFRNPRLVHPESGDFRLYEGSPCLGTATDGGNIGAYGGPGIRFEWPVLPPDATPEDVVGALAAIRCVDPAVTESIGTDAARYEAFREWAVSDLGRPADVAFAEKAYRSYRMRDLVASPTLLTDGAPTRLEISAFSAEGPDCRLTVRLRDGETVVPLADDKGAFVGTVRLGTSMDGLVPTASEDVRSASRHEDGTVSLTVRAPSDSAGFYDLEVQ